MAWNRLRARHSCFASVPVSGRYLVFALFRRDIEEMGRMERAYRHRQLLAGSVRPMSGEADIALRG